MAKAILPVNFKDDILSAGMNEKRRYNVIQNSDGTISLEDVTTYTQVGSNFGAAQINATNTAVNESVDKAVVIDNKENLMANTTSGKVAGALAAKNAITELNSELSSAITDISRLKGFSGSERPIGSWIDGRTVYRKCFNIGGIATGTTTKAHGIANLDRPLHLYGSAKDTTSSSGFTITLPYVNSADGTKQISINANNANILLYNAIGSNTYSAIVVMEYIKKA